MKGVILAAGYGSRILPITKSIPKEMLPLITKPSIDFIIEELLQSGISNILIVTSRRKKALEDYLDREVELEVAFTEEGSHGKLDMVKPHDAHIFFTRQRKMLGVGHALLLTKPFVGNEPFVVAYPDDLHFGEKPLAKQLIELYEETGCCVLSTLNDLPDLNRYGVLAVSEDGLHVEDIVEKPPVGSEPSREVSIGRYLYLPEIFQYLEEGLAEHKNGEYHHTPALKKLIDKKKVVYKRIEGKRYDVGEPEGYFKSILHYARMDPNLRKILEEDVRRIFEGVSSTQVG